MEAEKTAESPKLGADRIPNDGNGRPKGATNRVTRELKEMILGALDGAGGELYLIEQAEKNPSAFMTLIGKVLPMQVKADLSGSIIQRIERRIIKPNDNTSN